MAEQDISVIRKRGRPATGQGRLVGVRLSENLLRKLDEFREQEPDHPTRPEAIRRLLKKGLAAGRG